MSSDMAQRHVSRWRIPAEQATLATTPASAPAASSSRAAGDPGAVSLRYLDEFVRKLQCAPSLLAHQLFPDAKEITESMGLFNAVRRYVVKGDETSSSSGLADGIVVVGDGNTPRSAALFAYRLKQWKCYSVDPAMEMAASSARAEGWQAIENLVVIRNKIENVHIKLRRAVVVLVHAHVTLDQALGAIECDELVGVVTMPCCNWYGKQEELFGKRPSVVYDDFSILSDHRELRVWINPRGENESDIIDLDQSSGFGKGCVRKVFVAKEVEPLLDQTTSAGRTRSGEQSSATILFSDAISENARYSDLPKQSNSSPFISASQVATVLGLMDSEGISRRARLLLLSSDRDLAEAFVRHGLENVFTLQPSPKVNSPGGRDDILLCDVIKHSISSSSIVASLRSVSNGVYETAVETSPYESTDLFDCVIDCGILFRSLRSQPKKSCGVVFERLVHLVMSFTDSRRLSTRFITLTPRKDWRKAEYLANPSLQIVFSTKAVVADSSASSPLFAYCCKPQPEEPSLPDANELASIQAQKKLFALQLKTALEEDFALFGAAVPITLEDANSHPVDQDERDKSTVVRVRGVIQHMRRYTTGPSFFSITPLATPTAFRDYLQISMDSERLARWKTTYGLDDVIRLLHKGDIVECVGELALNAQRKVMLKLDALRFVQSEFQAYQ